jgi:hypothetical protein
MIRPFRFVIVRAFEPVRETFAENGWQPLWIILEIICLISRALSGLTYLSKRPSQVLVQFWVAGWLVVLICLTLLAPKDGWAGLVILGVALYRLQDLLFSTLDDTFSVTRRFDSFVGGTKVLIALVNIGQIVLIFTIAFSVVTTSSDWVHGTGPLTTGDAFVYSWSSLTPFAISSSAADPLTRTLTLIESSIAVLILLIALSRFMSITPPASEPPASSSQAYRFQGDR